MKKVSELDIRVITIIQVAIATTISLLFQFVFPLTWQPLDLIMYGSNIKHGDPEMNYVIATISLWYFSFAIACLFYRDNPYINNFLVYSICSELWIVLADIFYYHLYWDYIHFTPVIVSIYLLWNKRDTLYQSWVPYYLFSCTIVYFSAYFLHLAYFLIPLPLMFLYWLVVTSLGISLSFIFPDSIKRRRLKKVKQN